MGVALYYATRTIHAQYTHTMASPETKYNTNTTRGTRYGIPEAIEFADGLANAAALIFGAVTCVATATGLRGGRRNVRNGWDAGGRSSSIEVIEGVAKLAGLAGCAIACATAVAHQWRARMGCALVVDDDHSCRAVLYYLTHVARQTKWAQMVGDVHEPKPRENALFVSWNAIVPSGAVRRPLVDRTTTRTCSDSMASMTSSCSVGLRRSTEDVRPAAFIMSMSHSMAILKCPSNADERVGSNNSTRPAYMARKKQEFPRDPHLAPHSLGIPVTFAIVMIM